MMSAIEVHTPPSRFVANETLARAADVFAAVSGLFVVVVAALMIANFAQVSALTPLDNPELLRLRAQLAAAPAPDPALAEQIRTLDLLARKAYFTSDAQIRLGGYLLIGGCVAFLVALRLAGRFRPVVPGREFGEAPVGKQWALRTRLRETMAFAGVVLVIAGLVAGRFTRLELPVVAAAGAAEEQGQDAPAPKAVWPTWDEMQVQWPSFRGPGGFGVAHFATAPTSFDVAAGTNIRWKTEVPLNSPNSPVVWGNRVFCSGADDAKREVYCFDADSGALVWQHALDTFPGTPNPLPKVGEETGYAAPTMVAHGNVVCAIFSTGDLVCYDFDGNLKWGKNIGAPKNPYGHASSLIALDDLLFVQMDQKKAGNLFAYKLTDGAEAWNAARTEPSWASPVLVPMPSGVQLLLSAQTMVTAYAPKDGAKVWDFKCLDGEVAPGLAWDGKLFFAMNEYAMATAFKVNEGTPPTPEMVWEWDESLPDISSPVAAGGFVFVGTSRAEIVCVDAAAGKTLWTHDFADAFHASPIVAGDRVYAVDAAGNMSVFKVAGTYEAIAESKLDAPVAATPAILDKRMYIRTNTHLICVEEGGAAK